MTPTAFIETHRTVLALLKIDCERLERDFEGLDIPDVSEYDRAFRALACGIMPTRAQWEMVVPWSGSLNHNERLPLAHVHARGKRLPEGFPEWDIPEIGRPKRSVAHIAAMYGTLPESFTLWSLSSTNGHTVAHTAAAYGTLPDTFDQWQLALSCGRTVAHDAAVHGVQRFPPDFALWHLEENHQPGTRVIDYVRMAGNKEAVAQYEAWCMHQALAVDCQTEKPASARISRTAGF